MSLTLIASETDMSSPRLLKAPLQKIQLIFETSDEVSLNYDIKGFSYTDFDCFVRQRFRVRSDSALKYTQEYEGRCLFSSKNASCCARPTRVLFRNLSCSNSCLSLSAVLVFIPS
jgi:hypothetical protein